MRNRFAEVSFGQREVLRVTRDVMLVAGMILVGTSSFAQSGLPDAQVEANVLKSLAGAPELATQSITTNTQAGVVTLSGSVTSEQARTRAENLAANANGVRKVIDELRIGAPMPTGQSASEGEMAAAQQPVQQGPQPLVLQSDGTYAPASAVDHDQASPQSSGGKPSPGTLPAGQAVRNNPDADQQLDYQTEQQQNQTEQQQNQTEQQQNPQAQPAQPQYPQQPRYPQQPQYPQRPQYPAQPQYPAPQQYPAQQYPAQPQYPSYPQQPGQYPSQYPNQAQQYPPQYPRPLAQPQYQAQQGQIPGGQVGGENVVIPSGSLLRVRINRFLASDKTPAGTTFDGVVANDVVAGGEVAVPRGATVHGTVVNAKPAGALGGRGELAVQLNSLTLGGKTYPLVSDIWANTGRDKTGQTVNNAIGLGALGAVVGAIAGGGAGAAIGGGVGAAAGVGTSAASKGGQTYIPAEAMLVFHTTQETPVTTVSEAEMQRLAYGVPAPPDQRAIRRPYGYPPGYYPPPGYSPYGTPHE